MAHLRFEQPAVYVWYDELDSHTVKLAMHFRTAAQRLNMLAHRQMRPFLALMAAIALLFMGMIGGAAHSWTLFFAQLILGIILGTAAAMIVPRALRREEKRALNDLLACQALGHVMPRGSAGYNALLSALQEEEGQPRAERLRFPPELLHDALPTYAMQCYEHQKVLGYDETARDKAIDELAERTAAMLKAGL